MVILYLMTLNVDISSLIQVQSLRRINIMVNSKRPTIKRARKCVDVTVNVDILDLDGKSWKATRKIRMRLRRNWEPEE